MAAIAAQQVLPTLAFEFNLLELQRNPAPQKDRGRLPGRR